MKSSPLVELLHNQHQIRIRYWYIVNMDPYRPTVDDANEARAQADEIDRTAASIQYQGNPDTAIDLKAEATELRRQADKEENEAVAQSDQEKYDIDKKYGTG